MNSQNQQSDPPTFRVASAFNIATGKVETISPIKAAPERSKVSAVTGKAAKKPRARKAKAAQTTSPAPEAPQPTLTADEWLMIASLRSFPEPRKDAAMKLINHLAKQAEHPTEETPAVTLDPEPEPTPAQAEWEKREAFEQAYSYKDGYYMPADATTETIYDRPYRDVVRHGHIRQAWGVWGKLIAALQVSLPDMRDERWSDNLECTLNIIAETLAEHDY
jgi:hypothetical protein